ncbi:hypothetical protein COO60DRAFT_1602688, partial [Scenedesmus sp. NREL 46B-D3]
VLHLYLMIFGAVLEDVGWCHRVLLLFLSSLGMCAMHANILEQCSLLFPPRPCIMSGCTCITEQSTRLSHRLTLQQPHDRTGYGSSCCQFMFYTSLPDLVQA